MAEAWRVMQCLQVSDLCSLEHVQHLPASSLACYPRPSSSIPFILLHLLLSINAFIMPPSHNLVHRATSCILLCAAVGLFVLASSSRIARDVCRPVVIKMTRNGFLGIHSMVGGMRARILGYMHLHGLCAMTTLVPIDMIMR